jgi:parallel beta helix pectate lyase-like protein/copper-binding protein NosD
MEATMRRLLFTIFVLLAGSAAAALADEGRIPIFKPTTITQSGSYVVTRDITVASGAIITVQASDVTLDLNGKKLQMTNPTDAIIFLDTQTSTFRVKDGTLIGGAVAITNTFAGGPALLDARNLDLVSQPGDAIFVVFAGEVSVSDCRIRHAGNNGIAVTASPSAVSSAVRITGNVLSDISNRAIQVSNVRSVAILDNVISEAGSGIQASYSPFTSPGGSDIVKGNVVEHRGDGTSTGDGISIFNNGGPRRTSLVLDNVVSGFTRGMFLNGDGLRISGNVVHRGVAISPWTGDGLYLNNARESLIEGNQIQGNAGCAIVFVGSGTSGNAYRNNMLRGNGGGTVCNTGVGNTDAGGNIL